MTRQEAVIVLTHLKKMYPPSNFMVQAAQVAIEALQTPIVLPARKDEPVDLVFQSKEGFARRAYNQAIADTAFLNNTAPTDDFIADAVYTCMLQEDCLNEPCISCAENIAKAVMRALRGEK